MSLDLDRLEREMTAWRRDLHTRPEFGFEEKWTSAFVGDWSGEALVIRNNRLGERITEFERHPAR